jgi:cysteine-rich repeat protein
VLALVMAACTLDEGGKGSDLGAGGSGGSSTSTGGSGGGGGGEPMCGNNVKEPGEGCDDGNALPGDRCSPECEREDPDACPGVPIVLTTAGLTITDSTSGADNNTGATPCGGANSGDMVYRITPATSGFARATLSGPFETLIYARLDCPGTEGVNLQCAADPAIIQGDVTAQMPFYVFVDGSGSRPEEGEFTLQLELF